MTDLSRRDLLALGGAAAVGGYVASSGSSSSASGTTSSFGSGLRWRRLRPVAGGSSLGIEPIDDVGSAAVGIEGSDGEPWVLTSRHVVDPDYPDSERSDVIGTDVYQPNSAASSPVGTVVDCGDSKGINATDWAAVELTDSSIWTSHVLGLGSVGSRYDPSVGDRLIMGGLRTGIHGVEVTDVGLEASWKGSMLSNLIEYRVDSEADTAGNSGAWVGLWDSSSNTFRPSGLHTFRNDEYRYAIPASQPLEESGGSLVGGGDVPAAPDLEGALLEGALGTVDSAAVCVVHNRGDSTASERVVRTLDRDGNEVDRATLTLAPLEQTAVSLDAPTEGPTVLDVGDESVQQIQP